uniref:mannosyl-oligosaccharide 1,2-alpha-mannosidase n=1 Tax=Glossina morsitans morsitans TaxID=37546 RepID=A0A1B0FCG3_GLOMM
MDHLTCYLPGALLLGHHFGLPDSHMLLARDLLDTCYQTYMKQPTKLAPEISYFAVGANEDLDIYVKPDDAHNLLRPEFIESLYYFYALTGNHTYQDMGWVIFQAFERHAKVTHGYTSIGNVKDIFNTSLRDLMETFWLGETLNDLERITVTHRGFTRDPLAIAERGKVAIPSSRSECSSNDSVEALFDSYARILMAENKAFIVVCIRRVKISALNQYVMVDSELEIKAYYLDHVLSAAMLWIRVAPQSVTGEYNMTPDRLGSA